jgi:hypothetical protein
VDSAVVVPLDPGRGSHINIMDIMPWPSWFYQLCFVEPDRGFGERVVQRVADGADRGVNARVDQMLGESERGVLATGVGMVNQLDLVVGGR